MKKILLILICLSTSLSFAQKEEISRLTNFDVPIVKYGFYLGLHQKGFDLQASNASIKNGAGFHLGVLAEIRLTEHIHLLSDPGVISSSNMLFLADREIDLPSTYLHVPLNVKLISKRLNNVSAYVIGGLSYNHNFSAEKQKGDGGADPYDFLLRKHNIFGQLGIGTTIYFSYFKFSPSIRAVYALHNEFEGLGAIAKASLSSLKTQGIFLTLTFQ